MSKIYEALQRAEKERATQEEYIRPPLPNLADQTVTRFNVESSERVVDVAGFDSQHSPPPEVSAFQAMPNPSQPPVAAVLQVWQPELERLPAVLSRGGKIEQFRSLRSKLTGLRHTQQLKSIYVGSGHAGEGKSFVASNLAVTLARHKVARVLLIDGDLRRGTLHKILGSPNEVGLAEYLNGKASPVEIFQRGRAVEGSEPLPPGLTNLTFCSCGHAGDRAAELSGSSRFSELIREASDYFDWIVVDSSPVNIVSDGVNLARACDSALLVVRGGETKFETAQRALREMKSSKLLGVVLNAVSEFAPNEGHYGYQGYDGLDG